MTTELVQHQSDLVAEMDYARTISSGAILPAAYRGKPADILIATGLGKAIGIAPAQSLYEIYVVNGRPSPSANLMAALVRRAGHIIRIKGDARACTATLIRKDDPEFPFEATWTIEQANAAKLTGKDAWKQYPAAMLRARAISEVVRMGASECVLGMDYSREEMQDVEAGQPEVPRFISATVPAEAVTGHEAPSVNDENTAVVDEEPAEVVPEDAPEPMKAHTRRKMFALLGELGIDDEDEQRRGMANIVGRPVESRGSLTDEEAHKVIDHLAGVKRQREIAAVQGGVA